MYAKPGQWLTTTELSLASGLARASVGSIMSSVRGQGHAIESRNGAQGGGYRLKWEGSHDQAS